MVRIKSLTNILGTSFHEYDTKRLTERDKTFDFIKGMAVLFMMLVHVLGIYSRENIQYSIFGYTIDFLGGPPAAPVFMFSMGVFYIMSSKSKSLKDGVLRGVKLLILGYILNFSRSGLLTLIESNFSDWSLNSLFGIWEIDILQFAGLAYILMSLITWVFKKPIWWLGIAFIIMLVSPLLWGISSSSIGLNYIINFIWGVSEEVYFPIFNWLFYPLIGMVTGVLIKAYDTETVYKLILKVGIALFTIGSLISLTNLDFHVGDYFHSGQGAVIWILGFVFLWLWVCRKIVVNTKENKVFNTIYYWSKEITTIYCIHWTLVLWGAAVIGYENQGLMMTILLMMLVVGVTHFLTKSYKKMTYKYHANLVDQI